MATLMALQYKHSTHTHTHIHSTHTAHTQHTHKVHTQRGSLIWNSYRVYATINCWAARLIKYTRTQSCLYMCGCVLCVCLCTCCVFEFNSITQQQLVAATPTLGTTAAAAAAHSTSAASACRGVFTDESASVCVCVCMWECGSVCMWHGHVFRLDFAAAASAVACRSSFRFHVPFQSWRVRACRGIQFLISSPVVTFSCGVMCTPLPTPPLLLATHRHSLPESIISFGCACTVPRPHLPSHSPHIEPKAE